MRLSPAIFNQHAQSCVGGQQLTSGNVQSRAWSYRWIAVIVSALKGLFSRGQFQIKRIELQGADQATQKTYYLVCGPRGRTDRLMHELKAQEIRVPEGFTFASSGNQYELKLGDAVHQIAWNTENLQAAVDAACPETAARAIELQAGEHLTSYADPGRYVYSSSGKGSVTIPWDTDSLAGDVQQAREFFQLEGLKSVEEGQIEIDVHGKRFVVPADQWKGVAADVTALDGIAQTARGKSAHPGNPSWEKRALDAYFIPLIATGLAEGTLNLAALDKAPIVADAKQHLAREQLGSIVEAFALNPVNTANLSAACETALEALDKIERLHVAGLDTGPLIEALKDVVESAEGLRLDLSQEGDLQLNTLLKQLFVYEEQPGRFMQVLQIDTPYEFEAQIDEEYDQLVGRIAQLQMEGVVMSPHDQITELILSDQVLIDRERYENAGGPGSYDQFTQAVRDKQGRDPDCYRLHRALANCGIGGSVNRRQGDHQLIHQQDGREVVLNFQDEVSAQTADQIIMQALQIGQE